jgi:predicted amidohydrolase
MKILKGYLEGDEVSMEYAVLLRWDNIYYEKPSRRAVRTKTVIRLGLVQWQMRPYKNVEELMEHVTYFVDSLSGYKSDFALFPEFFNAPLMAAYNHLGEADAIRKLAEHTQEIVKEFSNLAISYNINIITGSMPEVIDDKLFNIGYLCRRDGSTERFEKIHITPQ